MAGQTQCMRSVLVAAAHTEREFVKWLTDGHEERSSFSRSLYSSPEATGRSQTVPVHLFTKAVHRSINQHDISFYCNLETQPELDD